MYSTLAEREVIRKNFVESTIPINPELTDDRIIGSIYMIRNIKNGKLYIGQTKDFDRRVSEYIRYSNPANQYTSRISKMYRIIRDEGIENFKIIRYYDCTSYEEMAKIERDLILRFLTILPDRGYNSNADLDIHYEETEETIRKRSESHQGMHADPESRRKRSNACIAISPRLKTVYFADSAALFGEVILSTSKDIVSHAQKRCGRIQDYWIIPQDFDLQQQLIRVQDVYSRARKRKYCELIEYIRGSSIETLKEDGFTILRLIYASNSEGYECIKQ